MAKQIQMTKLEAVKAIAYEGYHERRTKKGLRTIRRACKTLGLTPEETERIENVFEYRRNDNQLYAFFEKV